MCEAAAAVAATMPLNVRDLANVNVNTNSNTNTNTNINTNTNVNTDTSTITISDVDSNDDDSHNAKPMALALTKPADSLDDHLHKSAPPPPPHPTPPHSNGTGDSPDPPPPPDSTVPQLTLQTNTERPPTPVERQHDPVAPTPPPEPFHPGPELAPPTHNNVDAKRDEPASASEPAPPSPPKHEHLNGDEPVSNSVSNSNPTPENGLPSSEPPEPKSESGTTDESNRALQVAASSLLQKKTEIKPKSTLKLATVTPTLSRKRKSDAKSPTKTLKKDGPSPAKKPAIAPKDRFDDGDATTTVSSKATPDGRLSKRNRTKVQPYQSPTPELAIVTKLSVSQGRSTPTRPNDDKLIVFYKNEFLAVRNAEGGFYVCQTMQNVYRSTRKIKIRWLSQDKSGDPAGEIYKPDFYDITDIECVLTTLSLQRAGSAGLKLGAAELARTQSILGRALAAERGEPAPDTSVTEEHPDGLDLSLYKDESQLETKKRGARKRPYSKSSPKHPKSDTNSSLSDSKSSPRKRKTLSPKKRKTRTPSKSKSLSKSKSAKKTPAKDKQIITNSLPPISAPTTNKTATTPGKVMKASKKSSPKSTSMKNFTTRTKKTPKSTPSKAAAAAKAAQLASTPSTSTGKTTRTPRKPPSKK